jgi:uncharacterized small protein (DUF1192 family)
VFYEILKNKVDKSGANECKQENELLKAEIEKLKVQKPKKKKRKWLLF